MKRNYTAIALAMLMTGTAWNAFAFDNVPPTWNGGSTSNASNNADASPSLLSAFSPPTQPSALDSIMNPVSTATTGVTSLRAKMLTEGGKTAGFRGGLADRGHAISEALDKHADALEKMFQFAPLIQKNGATPPVIVEARDVASFGQEQVRTADRAYEIVKAEHFVSTPPTWRDYLLVGFPKKVDTELPVMESRPQNSAELEIWHAAVKQGWKEGQEQADAILAANFGRLQRDYIGMMRYSQLLKLGMIGKTRVAESRQTVSGDGRHMVVGEKYKRMTHKATFDIHPDNWHVGDPKDPNN